MDRSPAAGISLALTRGPPWADREGQESESERARDRPEQYPGRRLGICPFRRAVRRLRAGFPWLRAAGYPTITLP